jgi:hypothetical protein
LFLSSFPFPLSNVVNDFRNNDRSRASRSSEPCSYNSVTCCSMMSISCCFLGCKVLCLMWLRCCHISHAIPHSLLIIAIVHLLPVIRLPIDSKYFCWASIHLVDMRPRRRLYQPILSCSFTASWVPIDSKYFCWASIHIWLTCVQEADCTSQSCHVLSQRPGFRIRHFCSSAVVGFLGR